MHDAASTGDEFSCDESLLDRVGRSLATADDLQQVLDRLLEAVTGSVEADGGSVWLWDEERPGWLVCKEALHHGLTHSLVNLRLSPGEGLAGWVAQQGKSANVPCASVDRRFSPNIDALTGFHTTSLLAVPLRVDDAVIGVLEIVNKRGGEFGERDRSLIEELAGLGASAIHRVQSPGR